MYRTILCWGTASEDLIKLFLDYLETLYSETMSALKSCEVDFNNPPPIAQMIVSVNDVPLGTQGNLLCVTGGEGTGKSNYVAALIAGAIQSLRNGCGCAGRYAPRKRQEQGGTVL